MKEAQYIWMDGEFIPWKDAKIHVLSHTLHYGNGVFEGTRAYKTDKGLAIFRLREHTKRLLNSAKINLIECPYSIEELESVQVEILRKNHFEGNVYLRPIIFLGYGVMGLYHKPAPVNVAVAAWEWGTYLGEEALEKGVNIKVASLRRNPVSSTLGKSKSVGNYLNSQLAKYEAIACGYDEALLLDEAGYVAEGSGECFFIVRDGVLITPPFDNTLESITQDMVIKLAKDMGIPFVQKKISRDEIYISDEAFFTGTAAEVTPIRSCDERIIGDGKRGSMTKRLQDAFFDVVYARDSRYSEYLTFIG
ncbi:MAG: branched-chain-amino-acid transaminase [Campylobacterales bacterium]